MWLFKLSHFFSTCEEQMLERCYIYPQVIGDISKCLSILQKY